jgi:hypothetical protein
MEPANGQPHGLAFEARLNKTSGESFLEASQTVRVEGSFTSPMDFHRFPYDKQDLYVIVQLASATTSGPLSDGSAPARFKINADSVKLSRQYTLPTAVAWADGHSDWVEWDIEGIEPLQHSPTECGFILHVRRLPQYYVLNMILPISLLNASSWMTFLLAPSSFGDRLSIVITLILALLAFQFVINDKLPNTGYLTDTHKFITMSNLMLVLVAVESCIVYCSGEYRFCSPKAADNSGASNTKEAETHGGSSGGKDGKRRVEDSGTNVATRWRLKNTSTIMTAITRLKRPPQAPAQPTITMREEEDEGRIEQGKSISSGSGSSGSGATTRIHPIGDDFDRASGETGGRTSTGEAIVTEQPKQTPPVRRGSTFEQARLGMAHTGGALESFLEHEAQHLVQALKTFHPVDLVCVLLFPVVFAAATGSIFKGRLREGGE